MADILTSQQLTNLAAVQRGEITMMCLCGQSFPNTPQYAHEDPFGYRHTVIKLSALGAFYGDLPSSRCPSCGRLYTLCIQVEERPSTHAD